MRNVLRISVITIFLSFIALLPASAQKSCRTTVRGVRLTDFKAVRTEGMMNVSMNIVLDSLVLKGDKQIVLTPQLTNGEEVARLPKIFINGRKSQLHYLRKLDRGPQQGDLVVRRKNGEKQTLPYSAMLPYQNWMRDYEAFVKEDDCGCGDSLDTHDTFLAKAFHPRPAFIVPPAEVKVREIEKVAKINFVVSTIELNPLYMQNPAELDSIYRTIDLVRRDKNVTIKNINIHGFASPEAPWERNVYLAENRAKTLKDYVQKMVQLPEELFSSSYTAEDWEGLCGFIREGNLPHAEEILAIIERETADRDVCEEMIRKLYPEEYQFMTVAWYPHLRRSNYRISYVVRSFTVEEAKALIYTQPQLLSTNEMFLVAQTYKAGSKEFNEVMEIAVRNYPDDPIANLNAGVTRIEAGDIEGARRYIAKAGDSKEAVNARGMIAWADGDEAAANELFKKAEEMGLKIIDN